jgi:hypothetical protein
VERVFKLFTLQGANRMLPDVDARLTTLQQAVRDLEEAQDRARAVRTGSAEALGLRQELAFLVRAVHDAKRDLAALGVMVPDVGRGVVEFPCRLGGEVVHLVWERGQDAITHYHRLTGDDAPRPVPGTPEAG